MANLRLLRCHRCNQQTMHEHLSREEIDAHKASMSFRLKEMLANMMHNSNSQSPELREYRCTICRCHVS